MPLQDFANIRISIDSIGIALAGFGIPMVASANAAFPERIRFYDSIAAVAADFAATTPEKLAAVALFSQSNQPTLISIGRLALKPTQQYTIGAAQVADATPYKIRARGPGVTDTTVSITSATPATIQDIHNALVTAVNAVVGKNFTAAFAPLPSATFTYTVTNADELHHHTAHGLKTGDGPVQLTNSGGALPSGETAATDYFIIRNDADSFFLATSRALAFAGTHILLAGDGTGTQTLTSTVGALSPTLPFQVTGNAAGNWFSLEVLDTSGLSTSLAPSFLSNAQTHADPGLSTDLDAIAAENGSWYALYTLYNSKACILGAAAWTETQNRIYIADTCDTASITAVAGNADVMDAAKSSSYSRTLIEYHPSPIDMLGAALMGEVLPLSPGAETWAFKSNLAGPRGVLLTATHRVNLRAKNGNTYEPQTPDVTWTWDGKVADGEFLDTIRGLDSVRDDALKSLATVLANNPKVPYTDGGAITLGNELEGVAARAVTAGVADSDPPPVVIIPRKKAQSAANRRARKFAGLKMSFTLAGAIHFLDPVSIIVTQ